MSLEKYDFLKITLRVKKFFHLVKKKSNTTILTTSWKYSLSLNSVVKLQFRTFLQIN